MKFKTRNIFNNRKTKFSVDFGVCSFMARQGEKNTYKSDACPGCYSATLLNIYPSTAKKLETAGYPDMDDFKADITKIAATGHRFIRFYSLADFASKEDIKYIKAAAKIMPVELFSKTLHANYRDDLVKVASIPNVWISLSLNKSWDSSYIEDLHNYIIDNRLARNVQLNYCFTENEEPRLIPYISVYHTTKRNKVPLFELLGYNRVCCARAEDGSKITEKNSGNYKGSCAKCPLCKLPSADADGKLLTPKKREELYETQVQ